MKKTTSNRINMYQNVLSVLKENEGKWNAIPGVVTTVDELNSNVDELLERVNKYADILTGVRDEKIAYMEELAIKVSRLNAGLFLMAQETDNILLGKRRKKRVSAIKRMTASALAAELAGVITDAQQYVTELAAYGITPAMIQELEDAVPVLENSKISTRKAIYSRTIETKRIRELEVKINYLIIKKLDLMLFMLADTEPGFYLLYKESRKIIDYTGRKNKTDTGGTNESVV